jgi:hypothetical protein
MTDIVGRNLGEGSAGIPAGLGGSPEVVVNECEGKVISLNIKSIVKYEKDYFPATGTLALEEEIPGWLYNKAMTQNLKEKENRVETSIGGVAYNLDEGQVKDTWQSVKVSGLELKEIKDLKQQRRPMIDTGEYSVFNKRKKLYTNQSSCIVAKETETILPENASEGSVGITLFRRDNEYRNIPYKTWKYKSSEESLDALSFQIIDNEDGSTSIRLDENFYTIGTSADSSYWKGIEEVQKKDAECLLEFKGYGNNNQRTIYSNYYPIVEDTVAIYYETNAGNYRQIKNIKEFDFDSLEDFEGPKFQVDEARGILVTTGYTAPSLRIRSWDNEKRIIKTFEETKSYPESGFLTIGSEDNIEYLKYEEKTKYGFVNVSRALFDSEEKDNIVDLDISYKSKGSAVSINSKIYMAYKAVPRIDFEVIARNKEFSFYDNKMNLMPQLFLKQNGVLSLSSTDKHLAYINLSISKDLIEDSNVYGPLSIGYDSAVFTAELFDNRGNPVDETLVTFRTVENYIDFEGDSVSITNISNNEGIAKTVAFVKYSEDRIKSNFNSMEIYGANYSVEIQESINNLGNEADVFVFEQMITSDNEIEERLVYYYNEERNKYLPVQPINIIPEGTSTKFIFDRNFVSLNEERIVGYSIYYSKICNVFCEAQDPASGRTIFSNTIKVKLDLPKALKGAYISESQIQAVGFGFKDETTEYGTGLNGANFITINPDPVQSNAGRFNFILNNNLQDL